VSAARRRRLQARDLSSDLTFERALVEDSRRARQQLAEQIDGMQATRRGAAAARMRRFGAVAAVARGAARIGSRAARAAAATLTDGLLWCSGSETRCRPP
jgi:hypothetical protein